MTISKKILTIILEWGLALLKLLIAITLLAVAKVLLRTNPDLAIALLGTAAVMFLLWYFAPHIKNFFK